MDTKNYDAVDISKLILSLMVVALHTSFLEGFANPILRLAVPIFFIYSGFFFFYKDSQVNEENKPLKKLVVRNVKLYAAWFLVLLLPTNYLKSYFDSVGG
ncbi:MAG: hypothetical protein LUI14_10790 [Lachnospiraceae bacterium]|nr:hypothetical protein [Lachnospiraceae bacterium]